MRTEAEMIAALALTEAEEAMRLTQPVVFTALGNIPASKLRLTVGWEFTEDYVNMIEIYMLGEEIVRRSVHSYQKKGLPISAAQPQGGL